MITPKFNPSDAPKSEIYAVGFCPSGEWSLNKEALEIFRLEERESLMGLVLRLHL